MLFSHALIKKLYMPVIIFYVLSKLNKYNILNLACECGYHNII